LLTLNAFALNLVFGLLDVINVSQGALLILGAYIGFTIAQIYGLGYWLTLPILLASSLLIGLALGGTIIKPIIGQPEASILLTYGLALALIEVIKITWGLVPYSFPTPRELPATIIVGTFSFPLYKIFVAFVGALIIFIFWYFIERTNLGIIIRAGLEDRRMVEALGINILNIQLLTITLAVLMSFTAGYLVAPLIGVHYPIAWDFMLLSFVTVVIGGLGYLFGSIVSSFIISTAVNLISQISPPMANVIIFLLMFAILAFSPRGVLGKGR
jgi:branched-chain amino acid transport system permease protein